MVLNKDLLRLVDGRAPLLDGANAEVDAMHARTIAAEVFMLVLELGFVLLRWIVFEMKRNDNTAVAMV